MADSRWLPKVIAAFPEFPQTARFGEITRNAASLMQSEGLTKGKSPERTAAYFMELYCPDTKSYSSHYTKLGTEHPALFERIQRGHWRLRASRNEIFEKAGVYTAKDIQPDGIKHTRPDLSNSHDDLRDAIDMDFSDAGALEGQPRQQIAQVLSRAANAAKRFFAKRQEAGNLSCDGDGCEFDPVRRAAETGVPPRSLMDIHHRNPLAEGERRTRLADFELLCPNCHRWRHALMRSSRTAGIRTRQGM